MSAFVDNDITNAGRALLAEVQLGATFEPTKIVMGSGYIPVGSTARDMTAVVTPEATLEISKWQKNADDTVTVGGVYSNEDITEGFYYRELALYAKATKEDGTEVPECLYSYGNAGDAADYMTAYTTGDAVERVIDLVTYIGNDTEVNLTVESGVYIPATQKGAVNGVAELDGDGKVPISQIPKSLLDFDYYMNLYGYTWTQTDNEEAGTTTIAVTLDSSSPVTGTQTAVISENEQEESVIDVTTVLDGVTTKYQHTLNDEGGEGGIYNG